ncbi:TonB-dependent receptor [Lysobacter sp. SG-8]|uniref:TonB-dependent receptor n=1 Tax=Marilutibacter penaei TaxID=2759900 RepID=A0A7W3YDX1_9GAMM|nr:TonB-dependent receptor [Lysobacter penaei]
MPLRRTSPLARALARALVIALGLLPAVEVRSQASPPPGGDAATELDSVQVLGRVRRLSSLPGAVATVEGEALHRGQREASLAEPLARVPGIAVLDRHNLAQDLQVQSRGFGARSSFGVRGLRLVVDGIPATAADGQGQAATFPLGVLDRVQVLRGPLALQHGNAAGGVIVADSVLVPGFEADAGYWSSDAGDSQVSLQAGGGDAWLWRVGGTRLDVDGYRPHSAARRDMVHAVMEWQPRDGHRLRLVADALRQPDTDDPLGLTRTQWQQDAHGVAPQALEYDTRKSIANRQLGLQWTRAGDTTDTRAALHGVSRDVVQVLAIPPGAQQAPSSGGGVIDLARRSGGLDLAHTWAWGEARLTAGIDLARLDERRRGYENFIEAADGTTTLGVRGRLRRDEDNRVDSGDLFAVGEGTLAGEWRWLAGLRGSRVRMSTDDHYIVPGNGDDSGRLDYREHAVSMGVVRGRSTTGGEGEWFASLGQGFETPTITELAYRPDGASGFNRALVPSRQLSAEAGWRWRWDAGGEASFTLFHVEGRDEIVPASSEGGRSTYANAGRTRRNGIEASWSGTFGDAWSYTLVGNWIDARFDEAYTYLTVRNGVATPQTVASGNRLPGVARASGFGELAWTTLDGSVQVAGELHARASLPVDDLNSDRAPGHARFALRADWQPRGARGWHGFVRVDNLFDANYVGSVIVNEGNGRYFEPGPGRTLTVGLGWRVR